MQNLRPLYPLQDGIGKHKGKWSMIWYENLAGGMPPITRFPGPESIFVFPFLPPISSGLCPGRLTCLWFLFTSMSYQVWWWSSFNSSTLWCWPSQPTLDGFCKGKDFLQVFCLPSTDVGLMLPLWPFQLLHLALLPVCSALGYVHWYWLHSLCHSMTGSEDENQHTLFLASTSQPCVRSWCPMTPPAIVDFQSSTLVRHYDGSISLP